MYVHSWAAGLSCVLLFSGAWGVGAEPAPYSVAPGLFDQTQPDLGLTLAAHAETVSIFKPRSDTDKFSNGVALLPFKGKLYAQWQSSLRDEDSQDTWVDHSDRGRVDTPTIY